MLVATLFNVTFWINTLLCIKHDKINTNTWTDKKVAYRKMFPFLFYNIVLSSLWLTFIEHIFPFKTTCTLFDLFIRLPLAYIVNEILFWFTRIKVRVYKPFDMLSAQSPGYIHQVDWFKRILIPHTISYYVAGTLPTACILIMSLVTNMFVQIIGPRNIRYTGYIIDPITFMMIRYKWVEIWKS